MVDGTAVSLLAVVLSILPTNKSEALEETFQQKNWDI